MTGWSSASSEKNMEITEYDKELSVYIMDILMTQPIVFMSWGGDPRTIKTVPLGIQFHVEGFIHKGYVKIVLNEGEDLFEVHLLDENLVEMKMIEFVYFDILVSVVDVNVEKTENYEERISQEYNFTQE